LKSNCSPPAKGRSFCRTTAAQPDTGTSGSSYLI